MNDKLKAFLSDFSNVAYRMYPHKAQKTEITNININRSLEEWIALNKETPSNLYFSPNFQYGGKNPIGSMVDLQDSIAGEKSYPCAFVFDFNLQQFEGKKTKQDLYKYIKAELKEKLDWDYKYIVETVNGFHVYYVLDKSERQELFYSLGIDYTSVYSFLAAALGANEDTKLSKKSAVFRLPYSYIWKLDEKMQCNIVESTDKYVGIEKLMNVIEDIETVKKVQEAERKCTSSMNLAELKKFFELSPLEVFKALGIDPGASKIQGDHIVLPLGSGYNKFFRGGPMAILYLANSGDPVRMSQTLQKTFKVGLKGKIDIGNTEDNQVIVGNGYSIVFTGNLVQLSQTMPNSKGELMEKTSIIFRNHMRVIGKGYVTSSGMGEMKTPELVIVALVDGEEKIIHQQPSKSFHNKMYTSTFFYGLDNDLGLFFNGIINDHSIPHIDIYERSGYYDEETIVLGDQYVIGGGERARILLGENEFELCQDVEQITAKEYLQKFTACYDEEFSVPLFLCAIALAGMNLWERLEVNPAVLVSGKTGCGKSTVSALLKKMLGYAPTVREMALPSLTAQPLKQMASDNAILFLEELTSRVSPATEELLRNVVNRDKAARGGLDGNTRWNFRSPLWVNGERTFKDESLNNRFCGFIMSQSYWKPNASQHINELQRYTAYQDIYDIFNRNRDSINDLLITYKYKLLDAGLPARSSDVRSYMFVINDIFNFGFDEALLIEYVNKHLEKTGLQEKTSDLGVGVLINTLASACITRKVSMSVKEKRIDNEPYLVVTLLYTDQDFYQMSRGLINSCVSDLKNKIGDGYIEVNDMYMVFKILDKRSKIDQFVDQGSQEIANIVGEIVEMLPSSVASNNKGFTYIDWI